MFPGTPATTALEQLPCWAVVHLPLVQHAETPRLRGPPAGPGPVEPFRGGGVEGLVAPHIDFHRGGPEQPDEYHDDGGGAERPAAPAWRKL